MEFKITRLAKLPDTLTNFSNIEFLTAMFSVYRLSNLQAALEYGLAQNYGDRVDLLKFINCEIPPENLPDLYLTIRPRHADGSHECGVRVLEPRVDSAYPRLRIIKLNHMNIPKSTISVPLAPCLSNFPNISGKYVVYAHTFARPGSTELLAEKTGRSYVGITRQGWCARWKQHVSDAKGGSPYRFHDAIRKFGDTHADTHQVLFCNLPFEDAMAREENIVAGYSLYPHGLNMIPGGHAGLRYLAKYGFKASPKQWENRHAILRRFGEHCARIGRPNPLAAALWRDDEFAASVICGNPNNFNRELVQEIRMLESLEWAPEQIAKRMSCNADRIKRLLRGATYARVH